MHLQQTKKGSRNTGGPQYYFHNLTVPIKRYLRRRGAVRVALVTPYGATKSDYFAVGVDHKLGANQKVVKGRVGHDRIQQGRAGESIGESIRKWFNLPKGDFERIDVDIEVIDKCFYLTPLKCKYFKSSKWTRINSHKRPLTITKDYVSPFWKQQIRHIERIRAGIVRWSLHEICRIEHAHRKGSRVPHVQETDILRASGPLKHFGVSLGPYVGKGYDCLSEFTFLDHQPYSVPIEIKRHSKGFTYQMKKYGKEELSRAIILCATHDLQDIPQNVDVIELGALCEELGRL